MLLQDRVLVQSAINEARLSASRAVELKLLYGAKTGDRLKW